MEVDKYYKYYNREVKPNVVEFGWIQVENLPIYNDYIVSYHSRSKFASNEEIKKSKEEGTSIALVSDYKIYFEKITGSTTSEFYLKWKDKEEELKKHWDSLFLNADDKQHLFMLKLSRLIETGQKFIMYSRGFKLVSTNEDEDQKTEI